MHFYPSSKLTAMTKLFLAIGLAACCMAVKGQAGNLDLSFASPKGYVLTKFPGDLPTAYSSSALQPDGKIVTAGTVNNDFAIARYNVDGTLDNSFSGDGMMIVDFGSVTDVASDVAIQPDGKIVVVGTALNAIAVLRLNPDGTIDNSFSGDGKVYTIVTGNGDRGYDVAVQPDGKIVVLGSGLFGIPRGPANLAVVRYNPDGTLDTSFSGDGIMRVAISQSDIPADLLLQPDGKIVTVSTTNTHVFTNVLSIAVARLNSDGSLDPSFSGGVVITDIGYDFANAGALQADGKIVVAGTTSTSFGAPSAALLLRYNPDGSLDNSFSGDGRLILDPAQGISSFGAVVIQPDGKIIASGTIAGAGGLDVVLMRFNPDGTPDNSFSGDGIVVMDFENHRELINSLHIWNNRLYASGTADEWGLVAAFLLAGPSGFSCPANAVVNTAPGLCTATVNNLEPSGFPAGASLSYSLSGATTGSGSGSASGLQFNSGVTTVTYSTTNPALSCSFTVTVRDLEHPQASYPAIQSFCRNSTNNYILPPLQVSDNCGLSSITFFVSGPNSGRQGLGTDISGVFLPGTNFVSWTIKDLSGNTILVLTRIIISEPVAVTIPDAMTLNAGVAPNTVYTGYLPASDLTLSAQVAGGTGPYTYLWSNGVTTPTITVSPSVPTTYTVTVTDALGCSTTASKFVNVIDVRCGNKQDMVLICKVPKGNPSNASTNCISANAVQAQLANGSYLGSCSPANSMVRLGDVIEEKSVGLSMTALSNPAPNFFTLVITGNKTGKAELVVKDIAGRQVEKRIVMRDGRVQLGGGYRPGVYVAELRQGNERAMLKLIKLGN